MTADFLRPQRRGPSTEAAAVLRSRTRLSDPSTVPTGTAASQRRELVAWVVRDLTARLVAIGSSLDALGVLAETGTPVPGRWADLRSEVEELAVLVDDLAVLAAPVPVGSSAAEGAEDFALAYEQSPVRDGRPVPRPTVALRRVTIEPPLATPEEAGA